MPEYTKFDENVYSDELIPDHLNDIEEVNRLMAEEGYQQWSEDLDQKLWEQQQERLSTVSTANGPILIKKACEHTTCPHFRCERSIRIGGIEI